MDSGHYELEDQLPMRNRKVPVCVPGVLRHPVRTQTTETETTGQCVGTTASVWGPLPVSPLQLVNIQAEHGKYAVNVPGKCPGLLQTALNT